MGQEVLALRKLLSGTQPWLEASPCIAHYRACRSLKECEHSPVLLAGPASRQVSRRTMAALDRWRSRPRQRVDPAVRRSNFRDPAMMG